MNVALPLGPVLAHWPAAWSCGSPCTATSSPRPRSSVSFSRPPRLSTLTTHAGAGCSMPPASVLARLPTDASQGRRLLLSACPSSPVVAETIDASRGECVAAACCVRLSVVSSHTREQPRTESCTPDSSTACQRARQRGQGSPYSNGSGQFPGSKQFPELMHGQKLAAVRLWIAAPDPRPRRRGRSEAAHGSALQWSTPVPCSPARRIRDEQWRSPPVRSIHRTGGFPRAKASPIRCASPHDCCTSDHDAPSRRTGCCGVRRRRRSCRSPS